LAVRRLATERTRDTCEARVSDLEVASKVFGTWIMYEQIADIETAGALAGTDAVDLRQHIPRTADRPGVGRQTAAHLHPAVSVYNFTAPVLIIRVALLKLTYLTEWMFFFSHTHTHTHTHVRLMET